MFLSVVELIIMVLLEIIGVLCDLTEYEFECTDFLCAGLAIGLGDIFIVVHEFSMGVSAGFLPPSCTVL